MGCATTSLSTAKWELRLPIDHTFKVTVDRAEGASEVAAWKASLGLKNHLGDKRLSSYTISVPEEDKAFLARDISGTYTLLPSCEAAENSLYIRRGRGSCEMDNDPESCSNNNDLYFFVDPEKCGPAENDHMVFSESNRRLAYGEVRPIIARLDPSCDRPSLRIQGRENSM